MWHNGSGFNGWPDTEPRWNYKDRSAWPREGQGGAVRCSAGLDALERQLAPASTHPWKVCTCHMCSSGRLPSEFLGEPDENSFGAPDVAEPIHVLVLDHFADEL